MSLTAEEIPKLVVLLLALGVSGFVTVWLASQIRDEIDAVIK